MLKEIAEFFRGKSDRHLLHHIIHTQNRISMELLSFTTVLDNINANLAKIVAAPKTGLSEADATTVLTGLQGVDTAVAALVPVAAPVV